MRCGPSRANVDWCHQFLLFCGLGNGQEVDTAYWGQCTDLPSPYPRTVRRSCCRSSAGAGRCSRSECSSGDHGEMLAFGADDRLQGHARIEGHKASAVLHRERQ